MKLSKSMSVLFIVAGIILLIIGIFGLVNKPDAPAEQNYFSNNITPEKNVSEESYTTAENDVAVKNDVASEKPAETPAKSSEDAAKQRGNEFEGYMVDVFAPSYGFILKEWNQGQTSPDGHYAEDELKPDLKIERVKDNGRNLSFWLECKYRATFDTPYPFLKDYQIERFTAHQGKTRTKILIAIGIGGKPASPKNVYIVPFDTLRQTKFASEAEMRSFRLENPKGGAGQYIDDYFRDVFSHSKKHR